MIPCSALDFLVFGHDFAHGMWLEFFRGDVHPDKDAPGGEDSRGRQADGGGMQQVFRLAVHELEHADQAFDRQRHHHHDQEARQEAPHPGGRADVDRALHFLFEHRLAKLQRGDRNGQQADAFEDEFEALAHLEIGTGIEGAPGFHCGQDDQADAADKEQADDQHVSDEENVLDEFHGLYQLVELQLF